MDFSYLNIQVGKQDPITLEFRLLDTPITHVWIERMQAREPYPLDHPDRFYGFNSVNQETDRALHMIQQCIDIINAHEPIIERGLKDINDQDGLNYLHNIFERYHGLLDQQNHDYWLRAPDSVRKALAELNLAVHRCEATYRNNDPRLVCTWFGLPKTVCLDLEDMKKFGTLAPRFGTVCANYVEIGKTLEDLTRDLDNYIADEAFKPFDHISADFVVRFYEESAEELRQKLTKMKLYYQQHRDFFVKQGYEKFEDVRLLPQRYPVAQLIETQPRDQLMEQIRQRQYVNRVWLS